MKTEFNKDKLYEILQMNGINSIRELCTFRDSLCYGGEFVSRKTIERACQTGKVSIRTLEILSGALNCTPEFFTAPDVIIKEEVDQCIVYLTDGRECTVKGKNLYWTSDKDINNRYVYRFYTERSDDTGEYSDGTLQDMVAEFCATYVIGIVKVEV